jgi:AraC-like DNA-binding protein
MSHRPLHTASAQHVDELLVGVQRRRMNVARLLDAAGIPPTILGFSQARVSQVALARLMRVIRRATRDDFWGLCSSRVPLGSFARCCRLMVDSPTLGDALRAGFTFFHPLIGDFTPRLSVTDGVARIRLQPHRAASAGSATDSAPSALYPQRVFLFFTVGVASWLVARRIALTGVDYSEPVRIADTYRLFEAPIDTSKMQMGLRFSADLLALPVVQNHQALERFLRRAPYGLLVKYRDPDELSENIRSLLASHLGKEPPSLEAISSDLGLTPHIVRRRLQAERKTFRQLTNEFRRDTAIELLGRHRASLTEVAQQLGFSEVSTFHRAFKSWTGLAPGEYRRSRLQEP